jgi:hypothetical protein
VVLDATGSICEPEDAEKEKEEEGESSEPVSLAVSPGIRSETGSPTPPHEDSESPDAAKQVVWLLARTPDRNRPPPASWGVRTPNPERESRWDSRVPKLFRSGIQIGPRSWRQKDYGRSRARNRNCEGGGTFPTGLAQARSNHRESVYQRWR